MNSFLAQNETLPADDSYFNQLADLLLNSTSLIIKDKECRICEVEFYLYQKEAFPDRYTHCDSVQLEWGHLYFHRLNGKGYKSGTYKCMDITLGDKSRNQYLGILIRSIHSITDDEFVTGPCLSVNYLLRQFDCKEVKDLATKITLPPDLTKEENLIKLVDQQHTREKIYVGPRVGLSDRYAEYRQRPYRYAVKIKQIKREKTKLKLLV